MSDENERTGPGTGDDADREPPGPGPESTATKPSDGHRVESRWAVVLPSVVGAAVTLLVVFVPLAPVLGGAVAGYLRNGTRREGAAVGGLSGLLVALPLGLLGPLVLAFFVPVGTGPMPVRASLGLLVVALAALLVAAVYFVGLGAAGGMIAVALRERNR